MKSIFDESDYNSIMDWSKPLFFLNSNSGCTPFQKVILNANKALSKAQKLLERIESAEQTFKVNAESIPTNATIRKEYVRCGKVGCEQEPHGPYFYAYWKEEAKDSALVQSKCRKKLKKKYIGTSLPNRCVRT